jgi:asparagine N-glycosylation enzyme membrane subunit Stt3
VVNGLALSALGLIFNNLTHYRISFRTVALLLVVMAMSVGIFELVTARTLRRHVADEWFLGLAGAASIGFALAFLALGFRWIQLEQPESMFLWLSSYFGYSAICMLALALRLNSLRAAIHRMASSAPATG